MGLCTPDLIAFLFDRNGKLRQIRKRPIASLKEIRRSYSVFCEETTQQLEEWRRELGLSLTTIHVEKFFFSVDGIGIEDLPRHFEEMLSDPASSPEEKADLLDSIKSWNEEGQFVLLWDNDYWLDSTGEVKSP